MVAGGLPLLSHGTTRFVVGPVVDLRQLDELVAGLSSAPEVRHVHVDLVQDAWVALVVELARPVALAEHLRRIVGRRLASCRFEDDTLVARLAAAGPAVPIPVALHGLRARDAAPATGHDRPAGERAGASRSASAPRELAGIAGHALLAVADQTDDIGVLVFDHELRIAAIGGQVVRELGRDRAQLLGVRVPEVLSAPLWRQLAPAYAAALRGESTTLEVESLEADVVYATTVAPLRAGGRVVGGSALAREVTAHKRQEAALTGVSRMFELSFTHSPVAKALVTPQGGLLRVNAAFATLLGRTAGELQRSTFQAITHPDDLHRDLALLQETLVGTRDRYQLEKRYLHADGHHVWGQLSVVLVRNDAQEPLFLIAQVVDITRQKQLEAALGDRDHRDLLTGLWTRQRLDVELEARIAEAGAYGTTSSLLSVQLDGFGWLLETSGHDAGDAVLRGAAAGIAAAIGADDACARLGGHQFAILLPRSDEQRAVAVARDVAAQVGRAAGLAAGAVGRASVGIATLRLPVTVDDWHRRAHAAMRRAQATGTGVAVWTPPGD
nr:sensor domain-containing diguanylate cyclase [Patulibacter sp. SYSU D01012]